MAEFFASETSAQFEVTTTPADGLLADTARFTFTKLWSGGIAGSSVGTMLSAGDPRAGSAGYVGIETVTGQVDGRTGSFVLLQLGTLVGGDQALRYEIAPGSGTDALAGIAGAIEMSIDADDTHRVRFRYSLPE